MTLPSQSPNLTLREIDPDGIALHETLDDSDRTPIRCAWPESNHAHPDEAVHTLEETADYLVSIGNARLSTERIRQIERIALEKLRRNPSVRLIALELDILHQAISRDETYLAMLREEVRIHIAAIAKKADTVARLKKKLKARQTAEPAQCKFRNRPSLAVLAALKKAQRAAGVMALAALLLLPAGSALAADRLWMDPQHAPALCPDQAETGACALFAFAAWAQARTDVYALPDSAIMDIYRAESQRRFGTDHGKLTIPQAFAVARANGIVPADAACVRVYGLASLALGPIVAGYRHTEHWHATAPDGRIAEGGTVDGSHAVLIAGISDGRVWLRNSRGPLWGVNGFGWISEQQHDEGVLEMWHVLLPGGARSVSEAAALSLADKIGLHVRALRKALVTLGYDIPCDSRQVMAFTLARSMEDRLSPEQERAKADAAMIYMLLQKPSAELPGGVTDEMIAAVWEVLKWR
jgi:hypothetical protein